MVQAYRQTFDSVEMCEPTNYSYVMLFGVDDEAWRGWEVHQRALLLLYELPVNRDKWELFIVKFETRMLSLILDQDIEVAVEAVRLLVLLARLEGMEDEE